MSALTPHSPLCPAGPLREPASSGSRGDPEQLPWLIRRIADDDRDAFAELLDQWSGPVSSGLRHHMSDRHRVTGILAGTFTEVWWLAGCHVDLDTDVMAWIDEIVQRRVADSRPAAPTAADPTLPGWGSWAEPGWVRPIAGPAHP